MKTTSAPSAPSVQREQPVGDGSVPRMELTDWAQRFGLVAGLTTRGDRFNLGLSTQDDVGQVMTRWRAFRAAVAGSFPAVVLSHQMHGTAIAWHPSAGNGWTLLDGFDAHATAASGVLLTVTVADCIPVYLAVPEQGVIALAHAGWRGIAGGLLTRVLSAVGEVAAIRMGDIVMHCGVGICGSCYEVGSEVAGALLGSARPGQSRVDLRGVLAAQAAALGVGSVSVSPWCSAHDRDLFFSHRASRGTDGRMVAYLGRPLA